MSIRLGSILALAGLIGVAAYGQEAVGVAKPAGGAVSGSFTTNGPSFAVPAVTGAPYSGEEVNERVQTLADGTHITQTMRGRRVFRDSMGRVRSERSMGMGRLPADAPKIIEITDPVAGVQYMLDEQKRIAHRFALPPAPDQSDSRLRANAQYFRSGEFTAAIGPTPPLPPPPGAGAGVMATRIAAEAPQDGRPQPEFKSESLGTQTIDGVLCGGRRMTTTYPTDFEGNDRPIVVTQETWMSPELKMTILSKTHDPRSGENTFRILNFSRSEPDAGLFQPPPDYSVVEEQGPVTVYFGK